MTDKQFTSLCRTIIGAALLIGGAIMYSVSSWNTFFIVLGIVMMFAEDILRFIKWFIEPLKTEDKDNEKN